MSNVFTVGQQVRARCSYAHRVVEGKVYTVVDYCEPVYMENFTFPAYVAVDVDGVTVWAHTHRFEAVE